MRSEFLAGRPDRKLIAALIAAVLILGGCSAGRGGSVPYEPANFGPPDMEALAIPLSQQRIAPMDKLNITVFQVEDLSGEFQVDPNGNLQFPLIGTVEARGKTPEELKQVLTGLLSEGYLRNPDIRVAITEPAEQTITVDGAVKEPGVLPIRGATTLIQAVALAKGTTEDANPSRVVVFRTIDGQQMAAAFDLKAIRRAEAENPTIYGNDIVVVDGTNSRRLLRDVLATLPVLGLFRPY